MAKVALLDPVEAPDGTETVVVLKGGVAKRASLGSLVAAALAGVQAAAIAAVNAARDAASAAVNATRDAAIATLTGARDAAVTAINALIATAAGHAGAAAASAVTSTAGATAAAAAAAALGNLGTRFSFVTNAVLEGTGETIVFGLEQKGSGAIALAVIQTAAGAWELRGPTGGVLATIADVPAATRKMALVTNAVDEAGNMILFGLQHRASGALGPRLVQTVAGAWEFYGISNSPLATLADIPSAPSFAILRRADVEARLVLGDGKWDAAAVRGDGTFAVSALEIERDPSLVLVDIPPGTMDIRVMNWSQRVGSTSLIEWVYPYHIPLSLRSWGAVHAATRNGLSLETTRTAALVSAGETGVVLSEGVYQTGPNTGHPYAAPGAVGGGYVGGTAHLNEVGIARGPRNATPAAILTGDGEEITEGSGQRRRFRNFSIDFATEMYRPRTPALVPGVDAPFVRIAKRFTHTRRGLESKTILYFVSDFIGLANVEQISTQTLFTRELIDGIATDAAAQPVPFPFFTVPDHYTGGGAHSRYITSGVDRVQYTSAGGYGGELRFGEARFYAAGTYPRGPRLTPGFDELETRVVGGYHKLYRILGGLLVNPATINGETAYYFPAGSVLVVTDFVEFWAP